MKAVGIDLGGTSVKAGSVSVAGEILSRRSVPVDAAAGAPALLDDLARIARELSVERAVGLGSPGLFDRARGAILESLICARRIARVRATPPRTAR